MRCGDSCGEVDLPDEQEDDDQAENVHSVRCSGGQPLQRTMTCVKSETLSR